MQIQSFVALHDGAFDPDATALMGEAFDAVCKFLGPSRDPLVYEDAALRIIEAARRGERDPLLLRAAALDARARNVA